LPTFAGHSYDTGQARNWDQIFTRNGNTVLRKSSYLLSVAACGALLASCGGNNTPDPTPTPTPTDTPTPTPTPAPPPDFDFGQDFTSTGGLNYIHAYFTPNGEPEVFSDSSRVSGAGGISFVVSPETVLYFFPDFQSVVEFTEDHIVSISPSLRSYANGEETLLIERPYTNALRVKYQRSDSAIVNTEPGNLRSQRVTLLGLPITTTDPISTDLSYTGTPEVAGGIPGTTLPDGTLSQVATFTIDAATLTVAGTIRVFDNDGVPTQVAELDFSTALLANQTFSGDITDATYGFTGRYFGSLIGANRDEFILVFAASHTNGRKYVGNLIAE
jgi:hypothetical protein